MNERTTCKECKYFHRLKYNFIPHKGFTESTCCIALTRCTEGADSFDAFVLETNENGNCEMFTAKRGN